jgi:carbon storage regulator
MLVVTRKLQEAVMVGDAEVRVLRVGRDGVQLGIVAAPSVPVHRREIYEKICEENRQAASAAHEPGPLVDRLRGLRPRAQGESS